MESPAVLVLCHDAAAAAVRAIRAGMEEEGVPVRVEEADGDAVTLACAAARRSALDVGIGVAGDVVCVHHAKLPPEAPALTGPPARARVLGHDAARLVIGIPLK